MIAVHLAKLLKYLLDTQPPPSHPEQEHSRFETSPPPVGPTGAKHYPENPAPLAGNGRFVSRTGPGKIENPHDIIEIDTAMIGAAYPTEMNKPVAMADVAGASGLAVTGAGGPVVAGTRFLAVGN